MRPGPYNLQAVVKICQLLRAVNSHRFDQSDLDTRSWYHGTVASMECLQAPLHTPSSPDRSRLVLLALDYNQLSRPKPSWEPVHKLDFSEKYEKLFSSEKNISWLH